MLSSGLATLGMILSHLYIVNISFEYCTVVVLYTYCLDGSRLISLNHVYFSTFSIECCHMVYISMKFLPFMLSCDFDFSHYFTVFDVQNAKVFMCV